MNGSSKKVCACYRVMYVKAYCLRLNQGKNTTYVLDLRLHFLSITIMGFFLNNNNFKYTLFRKGLSLGC